MSDERKALVKVAADALREAQHKAVGTTSLDIDNAGILGRFELETLLNEVRDLRRQQEIRRDAI